MTPPRSREELRDRIPMVTRSRPGAQRHLPVAHDAADRGRAGSPTPRPQYVERIHAYIDDAQRRDIRIAECITDAKGDRSRPPAKQDDPDAYVRVVDRRPDGVVIRGAKLHITRAPRSATS